MKYALLALVLAACGTSIKVTPIAGAPQRAPRAPNDVEIFFHKEPQKPYKPVAHVDVEGQKSYRNQGTTFDEMRLTAAELGCDGLIVSQRGPKGFSMGWGYGASSTSQHYVATCIVFD